MGGHGLVPSTPAGLAPAERRRKCTKCRQYVHPVQPSATHLHDALKLVASRNHRNPSRTRRSRVHSQKFLARNVRLWRRFGLSRGRAACNHGASRGDEGGTAANAERRPPGLHHHFSSFHGELPASRLCHEFWARPPELTPFPLAKACKLR